MYSDTSPYEVGEYYNVSTNADSFSVIRCV